MKIAKIAQPHVLVVSQDPRERQDLASALGLDGFRTTIAKSGEEALLKVAEESPDLIVLNWTLPETPGIEVCRRLKMDAEAGTAPVILLSEKCGEPEMIRGLETGADDFIAKPFSLPVFLARVRVQARRARPAAMGRCLKYEDITLDSSTHRALRGEDELKLGPTEFRLLVSFMERPGRVWSRDQLLDRVWGRDIYVDTRTVDVHVGRLRKALAKTGAPDPIRTVRGAGYALG